MEHAGGVPAASVAAGIGVAAAAQMGGRVNARSFAVLALTAATVFALPARGGTYYVTIAGLGGEADYEQRFAGMAADLDKLLKSSGSESHVFTLSGADATLAHINDTMANVAKQAKPEDDFVLILIGHGSYDNVEYKFNIPGPDISAAQIATLCDRVPAKRQLIVDTTSSSGGAVSTLQKPGRAVIAATKSGTEKNATIFARYFVEALHDPDADLDKNDAISGLEAFQYADRKTAAFYESAKRLATEHPMFEDTGKSEPVRAASRESGEGNFLANFAVVRIGAAQKANNDPAKRGLLAKKEELESQIDKLKYEKAAMDPRDYQKQLTDALLELARLQQELDK
jgi:hypothetical protein